MSIFPIKILLATDGSGEAMLATSPAAELAGLSREQRMDDREVLCRKTYAPLEDRKVPVPEADSRAWARDAQRAARRR